MPALLPPAELQVCDANGVPYAGGSLATYVPGTTTPKNTWSESTGTILNTNPIILDAAGRCIIYADGIYRTILKDALGNLIWDQLSNTLVSAAMAPVCIAADLPTARQAMGITDAIAAEATLRAAADTAEATARAAADTAEATARAAADAVNAAAIAAETTRAKAAEAAGLHTFSSGNAFGAGMFWKDMSSGWMSASGQGSTGGGGTAAINFPIPFANPPMVTATCYQNATNMTIRVASVTNAAFTVFIEDTNNSGGQVSAFTWIATGF